MRKLLFIVAIAALACGSAVAEKEFDPESTPGVRVGDPGPDAFGYLRIDVPPGWMFQDISGSGTFIVEGDDNSADYTLAAPFGFYGGGLYTVVTPSTNGGLTFDGTYMNLSNVCPLPDQIGIFLFNDDLRADEGGAVYGEYFEICPIYSGISPEPCTIIQWDEVYHFGGSPVGTWDMEIVLFHSSFNIGMLFDDRFVQDAGGTTGIDSGDNDVNNCLTIVCDDINAPVPGTQYLILHPDVVATQPLSFGTLKSLYR